jgi:hypothetical protein
MMANESLVWERASGKIIWNGEEIQVPGLLLWAAALPEDRGFAIVTLFDESTPREVPNAFIYERGKSFEPLKINESGRAVRFLGCYAEQDRMVFNAANETEYLINPVTHEVQSTRYYR